MNIIIACLVSASAGTIFGFLLACILRGSAKTTPPRGGRIAITLHEGGPYSAENVEQLIREIERRSADGRVLNIKVA
jgi:hypothetical protein